MTPPPDFLVYVRERVGGPWISGRRVTSVDVRVHGPDVVGVPPDTYAQLRAEWLALHLPPGSTALDALRFAVRADTDPKLRAHLKPGDLAAVLGPAVLALELGA